GRDMFRMNEQSETMRSRNEAAQQKRHECRMRARHERRDERAAEAFRFVDGVGDERPRSALRAKGEIDDRVGVEAVQGRASRVDSIAKRTTRENQPCLRASGEVIASTAVAPRTSEPSIAYITGKSAMCVSKRPASSPTKHRPPPNSQSQNRGSRFSGSISPK